MSNYMQLERKKELIKRREVQEEFTNIVTKIFDVTLDTKSINEEDKKNIEIVSVMSKKLASYLGEVPDACDRIYDFARLQITQEVDFDASKYESEDDKFEALRTQTNLGSELISRIQLSRKAEDLIRAVFDDAVNDDFVSKMNDIQNNRESNIILTCDIYVIMRSFKPYKRPYNHKTTINYMDEHFKLFLDPVVYDRFKKFDTEFEEVYDNM